MNKIESMLLELFENYPQLTTSEIIEHTALARRTVQKYLTHLVNEESIEAYGEGRGRYYQRVYSDKEFLHHLAVLKNEVLIVDILPIAKARGFYSLCQSWMD